jgi:hypothetical protein
VEVKRLFSTTPETEIFSKSSWIETEANEGHRGDRTLNRTRSRHDRTRPVSDNSSLARGLGFTTGVSDHSWDRRVRSGTRGATNGKGSIGRGGASGHNRTDVSSRVWVLTGIDRTLALWRPVNSSSASGRMVSNANLWRPDA